MMTKAGLSLIVGSRCYRPFSTYLFHIFPLRKEAHARSVTIMSGGDALFIQSVLYTLSRRCDEPGLSVHVRWMGLLLLYSEKRVG